MDLELIIYKWVIGSAIFATFFTVLFFLNTEKKIKLKTDEIKSLVHQLESDRMLSQAKWDNKIQIVENQIESTSDELRKKLKFSDNKSDMINYIHTLIAIYGVVWSKEKY